MKAIVTVALLTVLCVALVACRGETVLPPAGMKAPQPIKAPQIAPSPYVLGDTEVRDITSRTLGRTYQLFVSLPSSYEDRGTHKFPALFVTDASYAFPLVRSVGRMVRDNGRRLEDFVLIGLSYAVDETPQYSRRRDYTPSESAETEPSDMPGRKPVHGEAELYRKFIAEEVFPFLAANYRIDMSRKVFAGHSYGGLFGLHILLTEPRMFEHYILSSPSLWFGKKVMFTREREYAATHTDMPADVFLLIGGYETVLPGSKNPRYNRSIDMVRDLRAFKAQLTSRHYPSLRIRMETISEEDHLTVYPSAISRGLMWALATRSARSQ